MKEIFINLTCIIQTPVYSEHIIWFHEGSAEDRFSLYIHYFLACIHTPHSSNIHKTVVYYSLLIRECAVLSGYLVESMVCSFS